MPASGGRRRPRGVCVVGIRATVFVTVSLVATSLARVDDIRAASLAVDARQSRPSMVTVSAHLGYHRDAIGAGVVVAVGPYGIRIVTARHVISEGDVTVWIDRVAYPADVVRTFAHRDIAVIDALVPQAIRTHLVAAALATGVDADDRIVIWGEDDAGPRMERGRIVATTFVDPTDAQTPPLVAIDCDRCERGDSGGGIFSSDGSLIAIFGARFLGSDRRIVATVGEYVDAALFASSDAVLQATAATPARTVRSQNDPKLSPE